VRILQAAWLGVVQGLTEFLPVSSSAHLILARAMFGWDTEEFGLPFDVACHVGTLASIVWYFRSDLMAMLAGLGGIASRPLSPTARRIWLIVAGTVPIVVIGLVIDDYVEAHLRTPAASAVMLAAGALVLFAAERLGTRSRPEDSLTMGEAVGIGVAQTAAIVPGVSRSGATISVAMLLGLRREGAARFTFLLGIPAILAAAAHEGVELIKHPMDSETMLIFITGIVSSGIVGYVTVKYFMRYLAGNSLRPFGWYRLVLAGITLVWLITR
jgi:undecaprenyl-diphosphatase